MTLLQWKEAFSVGIDPVDRDHRELIDLINRLHDELDAAAASSAPAPVAALLESISAHLALEEKVMQDHDDADLAPHKADRECPIDHLCDLIIIHAFERPEDADCQEIVRRLDAWLRNHFETHDRAFQRDIAARAHRGAV
jgi:hemerythrin